MLLNFSKSAASSFPPYRLMEKDYLAEAQEKYRRLERLYHKGHQLAWDGKKVLGEAIAKNGGKINLPKEKREAIAQIFSIILWGELAAWTISADLAERLDDVEAKMAASMQVFDEARHFYTMRDYLLALEIDIPPLDGYTQTVLTDLLGTESLVYKLLGMQLLVENIAVNLFKLVAQSGVEPVLCEIMPYFERDEARHVGLGVMYLPTLLKELSGWEGFQLQLFQIKINTFILWGSILLNDSMETIGIDNNYGFHMGINKQLEILRQMGHFREETPGILKTPDWVHRLNMKTIDLFFPPLGARRPHWQKTTHRILTRLARAGENLLFATR
jgi:hypothetical protein